MSVENFYESEGISFDYYQGMEDMICITPSTHEQSQSFIRDFSPLCFTTHYDNIHENPTITQEKLYDIHEEQNPYDEEPILNHTWVDRVKSMLNWTEGTEIYFQVLPDADNIIIMIIYTDTKYYKHKIGGDGYLYSRIFIPSSRLTNDIPHSIVTPYKKLVCKYNMNLEDSHHTYVLK